MSPVDRLNRLTELALDSSRNLHTSNSSNPANCLSVRIGNESGAYARYCNKCVVNQRHKNTFRTSKYWCSRSRCYCCCYCCCCSSYIAATMTMSKPKSRCRSRHRHRHRHRRERQPRAAAGVASHNSQSAAQFLVPATGNMTTPAAAQRGKRGEGRGGWGMGDSTLPPAVCHNWTRVEDELAATSLLALLLSQRRSRHKKVE